VKWNWRAIRAIMRKDLRLVFKNRMVWLPMILVPAILFIVLPMVMLILPSLVGPTAVETEDIAPLLANMPAHLRSQIAGLSELQQFSVLSSSYLFAPLFLIVPLMVSSVLAADSFVGERERRTLEALLYTPITDVELFVGKLLVGFLPAAGVTVASFFLYGLVVNLSGYHIMGRIFFPPATWWPLVFWVSPGVSVVGLGTTVLISSKVKTFMQAQQASGMLVLPIVFVVIGQLAGLFFMDTGLLLIAGAFVWLLGIWLVWIGARTFSRRELIARI